MREELLEGVLSTAIENARLETVVELTQKELDDETVGSPTSHGKIALQETMAVELEREKSENQSLRARLAELERRLQELANHGKSQRVIR